AIHHSLLWLTDHVQYSVQEQRGSIFLGLLASTSNARSYRLSVIRWVELSQCDRHRRRNAVATSVLTLQPGKSTYPKIETGSSQLRDTSFARPAEFGPFPSEKSDGISDAKASLHDDSHIPGDHGAQRERAVRRAGAE